MSIHKFFPFDNFTQQHRLCCCYFYHFNRLYVTILFLAFSIHINGQQVALNGQVVNKNNEPLEFVHVSLLTKDSINISFTMTDSLGAFSLTTEKGHYTLRLEQFGHKLLQESIILDKSIELRRFKINEAIQLPEITITHEKKLIERKVDRLVFNVEKSISSIGGDAIDILRITPGLRIQDGTLSMIGKKSVLVMLDEKQLELSGEDLTNLLKSIGSDNIKSIEVITNPSAKYSAEGNSGIVNIISHKSTKDYLSGSIRGTYQRSLKNKGYLGANITYQKNRWSLFANSTIGKGASERTENMKVFYPNQLWDTHSDQLAYTKLVSTRIGLDYDISERTKVGVQYLGNMSRPDIDEIITTNIYGANRNKLDSLILTNGYTDAKNYYHSFNGHFKTKLDSTGKNLMFDTDYLIYSNKVNRLNNSQKIEPPNSNTLKFDDTMKTYSNHNIRTFSSKIDVELPTSLLNVAFGGKFSFLNSESTNQISYFEQGLADDAQSDYFKYRENTEAAYINLDKKIKKWNFQLGLRIEATQTKGTSVAISQTNKNDYIKLFPTVYVLYNLNNDNTFSINYGRRINRPNYQRLNPFRWYSNPYAYSEGNPFLSPSFTDNIELSHTFKSNLNSVLYFSRTTDGTNQITLVEDGTNEQATVWKNNIKDFSIGVIESYQLNVLEWLESYIEANLYYIKVKSTIPNTVKCRDGINYFFSINNTFYFNDSKTFAGEINYWYDGPGTSGVNKHSSSSSLDASLKMSTKNRKLDFILAANNIFKTNISTVKELSNNINIQYRNYYYPRQVRISVVYRFGNSSIKSKQKKFSNEEERQRLDN